MKQQIAFLLIFLVAFAAFPASAIESTKPAPSESDKFDAWLADFKKDAIVKGISQNTVDKALGNAKLVPQILRLYRKQPEFTMKFSQYIKNVVPKSRIDMARIKMAENSAILDEVSKKYGVQKRFIVALWGIETDFGSKTGAYHIPEALANLAYEGRRRDFFSDELLKALQIIDKKHINAADLKGSWAGAMGQTQFMPSSYLLYAEDYDGDGKRDIWGTKQDVFASIANYLKSVGWNGDATWGRKVKLPESFDASWIKQNKTVSEWKSLGVKLRDGSDLPEAGGGVAAMLSMPDGKDGSAFLVYDNYKIILKWNRSDYFATSVGYLSDAIR